MLKYEGCEALLLYAAAMGRAAAKGADEQEVLAKLQGAIVMFMTIYDVSSSMSDSIYNLVFDQYQDSFIHYFEDKREDEQE